MLAPELVPVLAPELVQVLAPELVQVLAPELVQVLAPELVWVRVPAEHNLPKLCWRLVPPLTAVWWPIMANASSET